MKTPRLLAWAAILVLAFGCIGVQRTSTGRVRSSTRMERFVELVPLPGETLWMPPGDLAEFPRIMCPYVGDSTPDMDADFSEWVDADWIGVAEPEYYSGKDWNGPEDCSFRIAFAYDAGNLYVAAEAADDIHQQPFEGQDIWKGDSFQLGLDPALDRSQSHYAEDDAEIGWAASPSGEGGAVWRWTAPQGLSPGALSVPCAVRRQAGVTRFELAVPLRELGNISPGLLDRCGITFMYNDNDSGGDQERDGYMEWTPSMGARKDPSTFGVLQFLASPRGVFPSVAARLKPLQTVAEQGSFLEFRLNVVVGRRGEDGTLTVTFDDGQESLVLTKKRVRLMTGHRTYSVRVHTRYFPEGRGKLLLRFNAGEAYSVEGEYSVHVYPPIKWGT